MPVIVTGPEYATGVRWAAQHPEATASYTKTDLDGIVCLLARLRNSSSARVALAKAAVVAGVKDFDPRRIRAQFLSAVETAAQCSSRGEISSRPADTVACGAITHAAASDLQ